MSWLCVRRWNIRVVSCFWELMFEILTHFAEITSQWSPHPSCTLYINYKQSLPLLHIYKSIFGSLSKVMCSIFLKLLFALACARRHIFGQKRDRENRDERCHSRSRVDRTGDCPLRHQWVRVGVSIIRFPRFSLCSRRFSNRHCASTSNIF